MAPEHTASPEVMREKFARARRDGYAAWLWPDISVGDWRSAVDAITDVTRRVLAGDKNIVLASGNPNAMSVAGYTSGMGPFLGLWMERGIVGAEKTIAECFGIHLLHNRRRMERLSRVAREVIGKLNEAGISPLVLKGMHTAFRYFPEPAVRPMSDIDLLIPIERMEEAERVFSNLGFQRLLRTRSPYACDWIPPNQPTGPHTLTFVHEDDPWSIDVLGSLDKRLATGQRLKFARLPPGAEYADWLPGARVMQQPLLALYLAVHISQTLLNATVLRVLELALVIRRDAAEGSLDWNAFVHGAACVGGARFVYPALMFTNRLAPETIPDDVIAEATADAPDSLRRVVERLTVASAQPLRRHSLSERFMWARTTQETLKQIASEFFIDGQGRPIGDSLYRIGSKLWALGRARYSP